jgi:uncharacterized protein with GYD domain
MATYVILGNFTDQGIHNVRDTLTRAEALRDMARRFNVSVRETYWTLGQYDVLAIFDAPDEQSMTALALALGQAGNIRTQVLRTFNREEMKGILAKVAQRESVPA